MSLSRRTLLAATAGTALAACARPAPPPPPTSAPPTGTPTTGTPPPSVAPTTPPAPPIPTPTETPTASVTTPTPTPTVAPTPASALTAAPAPVPLRATVTARYAGTAPAAWGLDVPGVLTTLPGAAAPAIALTFDACGGSGGSGYDAALVDTLRAHGVPATLFLNARWIDANPAVFESLAADPLFEIANHGTAHRPLSVTGRSAYGIAGTRDPGEAYDEIAGNLAKLTALLGRPPRFFRSGTAHYDDVATRIAADLGQQVAGFSTNADGGATLPAAQVQRELAGAAPGDIVIAHMNRPASGTARGVAAALPALLAAGRTFTRLSDAFR
ncbi:polysaccharide deacetylase family protein [Kitasatospora sp. NPDC001527]|uniref:polysaccharide deacetylase family protein n=1 Tax=Kitasatospora sp. NPDC001527 TaxID=3154519 RepID=UPI00331D5687